MNVEKNLKKSLQEYGDSIECPTHIKSHINRKYNSYIKQQEKINTMKKLIITRKGIAASIACALIMTSTTAYAAPKIVELIRSKTIVEEGVQMELNELKPEISNLTHVQKEALDKVYDAFPEVSDFTISLVETGEGNVGTEKMDWTGITLEALDKSDKSFQFTIDSTTGEILDFGFRNWEMDFLNMTNDDLIQTVKTNLEAVYGTLDEFHMEVTEDTETSLKMQYMEENDKLQLADRKVVVFDNEESNVYYKAYVEKNTMQVSALLK